MGSDVRALPSSVMMLAVDDVLIDDAAAVARACDDIAAAGFRGVAAMVRCARHAWNEDAAISALLEVQRCARARGLVFWLIADPRGLALPELDAFDGVEVLLFGEAVRAEQVPQMLPVRDGRFAGMISLAPRAVHTMRAERIEYRPLSVERAYAVRGREVAHAHDDVVDVTDAVRMRWDVEVSRVEVSGAFDAPDDGEWFVMVFLRCATTHFDFSDDAQVEAYCSALSMLADRGLHPDGLMWDEPGYTCLHGSLPVRKVGGRPRPLLTNDQFNGGETPPVHWRRDAARPLAARRRPSIDGETPPVHCWLLALDAADGAHIPLRLGTYRAVQDSILAARARSNAHGRALWGDALAFGMHDTWRWESADPSDVPHGAMDLWRGLPLVSGGFTDIGSVQLTAAPDAPFHANLAMAILTAASLARHTVAGAAAVNLWLAGEDAGDGVADEVLDHCTDLLALHGCSWIGHLYGPSGPRSNPRSFFGLPFTPGYPAHETWAGMGARTRRLARHLDAVEYRVPDAALGLVYPVETVAAFDSFRARMVMEDVFRLALALADAQLPVHVVAPSLLAGAQWHDDGLHIGSLRLRALVAPHAHVLSAEVRALLAAGGSKVVHVFGASNWDEAGAVRQSVAACEDVIGVLQALDVVPELRRVRGPARTWVTSTRLATHEIVTLAPARRGWSFEGELRVDGRSIMLPRCTGLVRVRVDADGLVVEAE
jgi:hypothetical protein